MAYCQEVILSKEHAGFELRMDVKVLPSAKPAIARDRYGDSYGKTIYLAVPGNGVNRKLDRRKIYVVAAEMFETSCHHAYDCCGHWYSSVGMPRRVSSRTWAVPLRHFRNI